MYGPDALLGPLLLIYIAVIIANAVLFFVSIYLTRKPTIFKHNVLVSICFLATSITAALLIIVAMLTYSYFISSTPKGSTLLMFLVTLLFNFIFIVLLWFKLIYSNKSFKPTPKSGAV